MVNVEDFGAVCDGVTDDRAAIQAALDTGKIVRLPDNATCAVNGTLTPRSGGGLVGGHMYSSHLLATTASAPLISVPHGVAHLTIGSFGMLRSVTATAGGDGIVFLGETELTNISNMWIEGQWNGVALCHTATSRISDMIITANRNNGLQMVNRPDQTGYQWLMDNILCEKNGGRGFLIASVPCTMAGGNSVANMTRLASFANTLEGFYAVGLPSVPINGLRISNSFFGEDGRDEVLLDTYGATHVLTNVYAEIAGTRTTGPTLSTPQSNLGSGFFYTGNNADVEMFGCIAKANSRYGLISHAGKLGVMGGSFTYNCQAPGAPGPGIFIRNGSAVRINGARSGGAPQTFGLVFDAAPISALYDGCDFTGNGGGAVFNSSICPVKAGVNLP